MISILFAVADLLMCTHSKKNSKDKDTQRACLRVSDQVPRATVISIHRNRGEND